MGFFTKKSPQKDPSAPKSSPKVKEGGTGAADTPEPTPEKPEKDSAPAESTAESKAAEQQTIPELQNHRAAMTLVADKKAAADQAAPAWAGQFPLRARGRQLVNVHGDRFKYSGVKWCDAGCPLGPT